VRSALIIFASSASHRVESRFRIIFFWQRRLQYMYIHHHLLFSLVFTSPNCLGSIFPMKKTQRFVVSFDESTLLHDVSTNMDSKIFGEMTRGSNNVASSFRHRLSRVHTLTLPHGRGRPGCWLAEAFLPISHKISLVLLLPRKKPHHRNSGDPVLGR